MSFKALYYFRPTPHTFLNTFLHPTLFPKDLSLWGGTCSSSLNYAAKNRSCSRCLFGTYYVRCLHILYLSGMQYYYPVSYRRRNRPRDVTVHRGARLRTGGVCSARLAVTNLPCLQPLLWSMPEKSGWLKEGTPFSFRLRNLKLQVLLLCCFPSHVVPTV